MMIRIIFLVFFIFSTILFSHSVYVPSNRTSNQYSFDETQKDRKQGGILANGHDDIFSKSKKQQKKIRAQHDFHAFVENSPRGGLIDKKTLPTKTPHQQSQIMTAVYSQWHPLIVSTIEQLKPLKKTIKEQLLIASENIEDLEQLHTEDPDLDKLYSKYKIVDEAKKNRIDLANQIRADTLKHINTIGATIQKVQRISILRILNKYIDIIIEVVVENSTTKTALSKIKELKSLLDKEEVNTYTTTMSQNKLALETKLQTAYEKAKAYKKPSPPPVITEETITTPPEIPPIPPDLKKEPDAEAKVEPEEILSKDDTAHKVVPKEEELPKVTPSPESGLPAPVPSEPLKQPEVTPLKPEEPTVAKVPEKEEPQEVVIPAEKEPPEEVVPGTQKLPGNVVPQVKEPPATAPGAKEPVTEAPDVEPPEKKGPPEVVVPEVEEPPVIPPGIEEPGTKVPAVEPPEKKGPPEVVVPKVEEPPAIAPGIEEPGTHVPAVETPEEKGPPAIAPGIEEPYTHVPAVETPEEKGPPEGLLPDKIPPADEESLSVKDDHIKVPPTEEKEVPILEPSGPVNHQEIASTEPGEDQEVVKIPHAKDKLADTSQDTHIDHGKALPSPLPEKNEDELAKPEIGEPQVTVPPETADKISETLPHPAGVVDVVTPPKPEDAGKVAEDTGEVSEASISKEDKSSIVPGEPLDTGVVAPAHSKDQSVNNIPEDTEGNLKGKAPVTKYDHKETPSTGINENPAITPQKTDQTPTVTLPKEYTPTPLVSTGKKTQPSVAVSKHIQWNPPKNFPTHPTSYFKTQSPWNHEEKLVTPHDNSVSSHKIESEKHKKNQIERLLDRIITYVKIYDEKIAHENPHLVTKHASTVLEANKMKESKSLDSLSPENNKEDNKKEYIILMHEYVESIKENKKKLKQLNKDLISLIKKLEKEKKKMGDLFHQMEKENDPKNYDISAIHINSAEQIINELKEIRGKTRNYLYEVTVENVSKNTLIRKAKEIISSGTKSSGTKYKIAGITFGGLILIGGLIFLFGSFYK